MIGTIPVGKVHHVKSLDEAIGLYAQARIACIPLPTFTTTTAEWPSFKDDCKHSYHVEHKDEQGRVYEFAGVILHVRELAIQA